MTMKGPMCAEEGRAGNTYTTICLRPRRGLRMNLRVRRVTGESLSAIFAVVDVVGGRAVGRVVKHVGNAASRSRQYLFLAEDRRGRDRQRTHRLGRVGRRAQSEN